MELKVQNGDITTWKGDGIVVNLFEGAMSPDGAASAVDKKLRGVLTKMIKQGEIKGKLGSVTIVHTFDKLPAERVCVVGLGKQGEFTLDRARQAAANGVKALRDAGAKKIASVVHGAGGLGNLDAESAAQANAEGILLGLWQFRKYFSDNSDVKTVDEVVLLERDPSKIKMMKAGAARGEIIAQATNLARDLTNEPGNAMTPTRLAQVAKEIAKKYGLEFDVIDRDKAKKLGMGAFLAVAQGSDEPPCIIILRYLGGGKKSAPGLGLVGKVITFDSGGISKECKI